jgi:4'-phosphopantetheinyl transferase
MPITKPAFRLRTPLRLADDEVQVWSARLDSLVAFANNLTSFLTEDEQERTRRFRFPHHGQRFAIARGLLRSLLAGYLEIDPSQVVFEYSEKGKPSLGNASSARRVHFNLSHSEDIALFAFTTRGDVGVDVEKLRQNFSPLEIAQRFFSPAEAAALSALPVEQQHEGFFNCWTRKEAFVKALGEGLSLPLHRFDVSLLPGQPAELLATRPDAAERNRWWLSALDVTSDCKAAVAVRGTNLRATLTPAASLLDPQPA